MKLDNSKLHKLFVEKNITTLFHANTVATSITFIEQNGLLSRGAVDNKGLIQTPQSSDNIDKIFDVYNDVFVDTIDLHGYFPRQNLYGPVSFQFSIDFLIEKDFDVWVTKDNPIYWTKEMTNEDRYFTTVEELKEDWGKYQRQKKMVTIKNQVEPILFDYLKQVVVDNPNVKVNDLVFFDECVKGIKQAVTNHKNLINKFTTRVCNSCFCRDNYLHQVSVPELKKLFLPINK